MDENNDSNVVETMKKYADKLLNLADNMDETSKKTENEHIGKVANIIKILVGTMENAYDLEDFHHYCKIFSIKQMVTRLGDKELAMIRESLNDFYDNHDNHEDDEDDNN